MTLAEIKQKIADNLKLVKQMFADAPPPPVTATAALSAVPLKDGRMIQADKMEAGGIVSLVTDAGSSPLPAGDYELQDGTMLVIAEGGVISTVTPGDAADPMADFKTQFSTFQATANEKFTAYEAQFAAMKAQQEHDGKVIKGILQLTELIAEAPTGEVDPATGKPGKFAQSEDTRTYIEKAADAFKNS